ncbi:MAG: restriction endonuclease [Candidatus Marsarchaeota archaeon]|nr:restriction endonuclease [Candidatus Marsarchaeota archaeon]
MENTLFYGDNLDILRNKDYIKNESVDLVYLDPPFNSKATYNVLFREWGGEKSNAQIEAFTDFWTWDEQSQRTYEYLISNQNVPVKLSKLIHTLHDFLGTNDMSAYLVMMSARLIELHKVLKKSGSLYLHCDPTASHYLKLVLDAIFDEENFIAEIIWAYGTASGGRTKGNKPVKGHDTILAYAKSYGIHIYNKIYLPYSQKYIAERFTGTDENGRIYRTRKRNSGEIQKQYLDESPGVPLSDVWTDIKQLYAYHLIKRKQEELGYPTQKPLALLERIVKIASNKGDVVLDPFCGCGTAIDASQKLDRKWIGIDITHLAVNLIKRRIHDKYPKAHFEVVGEPKDLEGAKQLANTDRYQFEWWALSLVDARPINKKQKGSDKGADGIKIINTPEVNQIITILVQVKSGEHVKSGDIRDLKGTMEREKAQFGIFITLEEPTKDMITEAVSSGTIKVPLVDKSIPKIEILTIKQLLDGQKPMVSYIPRKEGTYQKAVTVEDEEEDDEPKSYISKPKKVKPPINPKKYKKW